MVDKSCASYLYQKRGVYYFSKQVPCDVRQHCKRDGIVLCLKTKSVSRANRLCDSILQSLHDYWLLLRLSAMPLPAAHLVHDSNGHGHLSSGPTLSEARDAYIKLKGVGKDKTFIRGASRNVYVVIKHLGDKPIDAYTSADAAALRDAMLEKRLSTQQLSSHSPKKFPLEYINLQNFLVTVSPLAGEVPEGKMCLRNK